MKEGIKLTIISISVFILIALPCLSQSKKISSTINSSSRNNTANNTSLSKYYLDTAQALSKKSPLQAIDQINKGIALSIQNNDQLTEAQSYLILGNIQQGLKQHELAIENYNKCIQTLNVVPKKTKFIPQKNKTGADRILLDAFKNKAISYIQLNQPEEAEKALNNYFNVGADATNQDMNEIKIIQSELLLKQGKQKESIELLGNWAQQEKNNGNSRNCIKTLIVLGKTQLNLNNHNKSVETLTEAKKMAEQNNMNDLLMEANNLLAEVYQQQQQTEKELQARNSIINNNTLNYNTVQIAEQNTKIGNAYAKMNQMDKALPYYEKSLLELNAAKLFPPSKLFDKSNNLEEMANTYKLLAEEYLKQGNTEKAMAYLKTFAQIQDSIKNIRSKELNEALKISNEAGKNQQRIELLEKEKNLNEKSIEILKQDKDLKEGELYIRNMVIGGLCFLILFMAGASFYIIKSSREKRKANQLLAIKSLRGQMNPHFIFNALNSVNHYISQNDERAANKYLSDFSKLMRSVLETTKADFISLGEELEILKLYLQLEHARFKEKYEYQLLVDEKLDVSEFEIPPMIVQPFIENAIWHGLRYIDKMGLLTICFIQQTEGLSIEITDNGIGRNKSLEIKTKNQKNQRSTGMQNIENRIGIMNNLFKTSIRVNITDAFPSNENKGTRVELFIPLNLNKHA